MQLPMRVRQGTLYRIHCDTEMGRQRTLLIATLYAAYPTSQVQAAFATSISAAVEAQMVSGNGTSRDE